MHPVTGSFFLGVEPVVQLRDHRLDRALCVGEGLTMSSLGNLFDQLSDSGVLSLHVDLIVLCLIEIHRLCGMKLVLDSRHVI